MRSDDVESLRLRIAALLAEHVNPTAIARRLNCSRTTVYRVRAELTAGTPTRDRRRDNPGPRRTITDAQRAVITALLDRTPRLSAHRIRRELARRRRRLEIPNDRLPSVESLGRLLRELRPKLPTPTATRRDGDAGTRGHGDAETRGHGDAESLHTGDVISTGNHRVPVSPCPRVSSSCPRVSSPLAQVYADLLSPDERAMLASLTTGASSLSHEIGILRVLVRRHLEKAHLDATDDDPATDPTDHTERIAKVVAVLVRAVRTELQLSENTADDLDDLIARITNEILNTEANAT